MPKKTHVLIAQVKALARAAKDPTTQLYILLELLSALDGLSEKSGHR